MLCLRLLYIDPRVEPVLVVSCWTMEWRWRVGRLYYVAEATADKSLMSHSHTPEATQIPQWAHSTAKMRLTDREEPIGGSLTSTSPPTRFQSTAQMGYLSSQNRSSLASGSLH